MALFVLIGLVAALLRIWGIGDRPLWYDELQSVTHAIQPFSDVAISVISFDPHPPLYYQQLHVWMSLFGTGEAWIRLNSVLWSLLTLVPLFLLGRRLFGTRGALLAVWLFALAPLAVKYAQDVRMYPMQMCLAVTSLYFLERLISDPPRLALHAAFFLSLIAAVYCQGAGFLLLASAGAYALLRLGSRLFTRKHRGLLVAGLAAGVLTLPWVFLARDTSLDHLEVPTVAGIGADLYALVFGSSGGFQDRWAAGIVVMASIVVCGTVILPRTRILASSYIVLPLAVIVVLSFLIVPLWYLRLLSTFLPMCILAVVGIVMAMSDRLGRYGPALQLFAALCALTLLPQSLAVSGEERFSQRFNELADYLVATTGPDDVISFENVRDSWGVAWYSADRHILRTVEREQAFAIGSGASLLYRPSDEVREQATVRVLRRGHPAIAPGSPGFDRLFVVRVDGAEAEG